MATSHEDVDLAARELELPKLPSGNDAVLSLDELAGAQWKPQETWHILTEHDIIDGIDELDGAARLKLL